MKQEKRSFKLPPQVFAKPNRPEVASISSHLPKLEARLPLCTVVACSSLKVSSTCACNARIGFVHPRSCCLTHGTKFNPQDAHVSITNGPYGICDCGTSDCLDSKQKHFEQNSWPCAPFGNRLLCMRWHVRRTGSASCHFCIDKPALPA